MRERFPTRQHGVDIEAVLAHDLFHAGHVSRSLEDLARAKKCLARHAPPVGTLAADEFVLDDHGSAVTSGDGVARGILADGPAADDDDVEFLGSWICHHSSVT